MWRTAVRVLAVAMLVYFLSLLLLLLPLLSRPFFWFVAVCCCILPRLVVESCRINFTSTLFPPTL
jgi:hypothetical protein